MAPGMHASSGVHDESEYLIQLFLSTLFAARLILVTPDQLCFQNLNLSPLVLIHGTFMPWQWLSSPLIQWFCIYAVSKMDLQHYCISKSLPPHCIPTSSNNSLNVIKYGKLCHAIHDFDSKLDGSVETRKRNDRGRTGINEDSKYYVNSVVGGVIGVFLLNKYG